MGDEITIEVAGRGFAVAFEPAEDGGVYAHIPELDITTDGGTRADAEVMARDAIEGWLEVSTGIWPIPGGE